MMLLKIISLKIFKYIKYKYLVKDIRMSGVYWLLVASILISSIASLKEHLKVQLHGNQSTGYYDVYMILGGQRQRLTADTGSHRLVVQCGRCSTCFDGELPNYKDTLSGANKHVQCVLMRIFRTTEILFVRIDVLIGRIWRIVDLVHLMDHRIRLLMDMKVRCRLMSWSSMRG